MHTYSEHSNTDVGLQEPQLLGSKCWVAIVKIFRTAKIRLVQAQHSGLPMANIALSLSHRADGSATCSQNGYSVIAAVNGPMDVQRRDELPEEATVDVAVRPAAGVGGRYQLVVE